MVRQNMWWWKAKITIWFVKIWNIMERLRWATGRRAICWAFMQRLRAWLFILLPVSHIFSSHLLYLTQQTVSCGTSSKIIRHKIHGHWPLTNGQYMSISIIRTLAIIISLIFFFRKLLGFNDILSASFSVTALSGGQYIYNTSLIEKSGQMELYPWVWVKPPQLLLYKYYELRKQNPIKVQICMVKIRLWFAF